MKTIQTSKFFDLSIAEDRLSDGSPVYNVIIGKDPLTRILIECADLLHAERIFHAIDTGIDIVYLEEGGRC
jgi:hypothetical protein